MDNKIRYSNNKIEFASANAGSRLWCGGNDVAALVPIICKYLRFMTPQQRRSDLLIQMDAHMLLRFQYSTFSIHCHTGFNRYNLYTIDNFLAGNLSNR